MTVERITDCKYIVYFNNDETEKLRVLARTFNHGNKAATLSELITEGFEVSMSVKALFEDKEETEAISKRFCETQKARVDRLWKDRNNDCKRKHE